MTLLKTRIIVSAAVFAANLALSLSSGTAQAQAPHHGVLLASQQHALQMDAPSAAPASDRPAIKREMSMSGESDFSGFCGFSGPNAC